MELRPKIFFLRCLATFEVAQEVDLVASVDLAALVVATLVVDVRPADRVPVSVPASNCRCRRLPRGCEKKLKVPHYVSCPDCKGTGAQDNSFSTCSQCHGSGYITRVQRTILGAMQTQTVCPACGGDGKSLPRNVPSVMEME